MKTESFDTANHVPNSVQWRLVGTIFTAQSLMSAAFIASFVLMPIISVELSGMTTMAGVPNTVLLLGRAVIAYPVGWLMDRVGRRPGLALGYALAAIGGFVCVLAISMGSFILFCIGTGLSGMARGVSEQARFAAAESRPPALRARALSLIVFAGTFGAIGGPLLVDPSGRLAQAWFGVSESAGPFLLGGLLMTVATLLTLAFLRPDPMTVAQRFEGVEETKSDEPLAMRPLGEIFSGRGVQLGMAAMILSQFVMTYLMVITPLHMSGHDHTIKAISWVIMAHTLGMFGLSSVTGWLIEQFGRVNIILAGSAILVISAILTPLWLQVPQLALALFLLGLGWNFCFIAGSSLLSDTLQPHERGRVQGANETMVALASGFGSLITGITFAFGGILAAAGIGLFFSLALLGFTLLRRTPATV